MPLFSGAFWWEPFVTMGLIISLAAVLVVAGRRSVLDVRNVPAHVRWGVLAASAGAFVLRQFAVAPAFLHDDFIGPGIATVAFQFPPDPSASWHYGREYGLAGFTVLSLCAAAFGRTVETVMTANVVFSTLTTIPLAVLAALWARSASAGLFAAAIWATSPLVARLAHSEDLHTLGMLWAITGLALIEIALLRRSRLPLIGAVVALLLAALTRQTFYPWLGIAGAIFVERWWRKQGPLFGDRLGFPVLLVAALGALLIGLRMHFAVDSWEFADVVTVHGIMFSRPDLAWDILVHHPIFSFADVSFTVPLFGSVGLFLLAGCSASPLAILAAVAALFVAYFPIFPNLGSDWPFRFHFYTLMIIAAGIGAAWIVARVASRMRWCLDRRWAVSAPVALALLGLCASATHVNRIPNPEYLEYVFAREALSRLDRPFTIIGNGGTHLASRIMELWAYDANLPVVAVSDPPAVFVGKPRPFVFLYGLGCHAYNLANLMALSEVPEGRPSEETMSRFHQLARDRSKRFGMDVGTLPTEMHAVCAEILRRSTTIAEGAEIELRDEPPWSIFNVDRLRPRLVRWDRD